MEAANCTCLLTGIQVDILDEKSEQLSLRTPVPAVWLQLATFAPALTESPHPHTPVTRTFGGGNGTMFEPLLAR